MTTSVSEEGIRIPREVVPETVRVPGWVDALVESRTEMPRGNGLATAEGNEFALTTGVIAGATGLGALDLQHAACALYLEIAARLRSIRASHAVRFWNFIPRIHARMGSRDGGMLDRYMVFNAGRFAAYVRWHGQEDVGSQAATATGIGHTGDDLVVHCLSCERAGEPVENPRQVPAYRYSKRRGPMPPCFARATLVDTGTTPVLLVGGTASVRGEESAHLGDIREQTLETFRNMAALLGMGSSARAIRAGLARYRSLRVYIVHSIDAYRVREMVAEHFAEVRHIEYVRADVCRRTLLVEIEGTADAAGLL